jgi:hypothetical protein
LIYLRYLAVLPETIDVVLSLAMIGDLSLEKLELEMSRAHVGNLPFLDERQAYVLDYEYLQIHLSENTISFEITHFDGSSVYAITGSPTANLSILFLVQVWTCPLCTFLELY